VLLAVAGALKFYSVAASASVSLSSDFFLTTSLAGAEIGFGCWMLAGLYPRVTRWAAALCFLGFLGVSLAKVFQGEHSCGCFGPVLISPWITAALDGFVFVALVYAKPSGEADAAAAGRRWTTFALLSGASAIVVAVLFVLAGPARLDENGRIEGVSATVVLRPEDWIGRPCPLFGHIDVGGRLEQGEWIVLFYRPDCSDCQQMLPRYLRRAAEDGLPTEVLGWAVVDVAGVGGPNDGRVASSVLSGSLYPGRRWAVRTPTILRLRNGIVTQVAHSLEEVQG
jgi:hypothetical protein